ncbi:HD-domain/PDEase-like protein [Dentipellis sp. KUC8613]|nr:HD-domain/PDEase-like protein [Dentipellis sp. KUC8613]
MASTMLGLPQGALAPAATALEEVMARRLRDPIHDYIELHPKVWQVIDTKHFQRLRSIKQLGTSYYVWPGASHNRFEHCLGVAYLARIMIEHLVKSQPELAITARDVECVELAGLCHDLGHGPWSHVWDNQFIPKALKGKKWQHEDASEMMFDDMIKAYDLDIPPKDATFIKALIAGNPEQAKGEKSFLFDIVANKRNGVDVDKFDYIARDSRAIGDSGNLSLSRLIHSARVIDNQICYDIKDANQIYELCHTRFSLHKRIYHHKTAKAIEYMIIDAMLAAEPYLKIAEQIEDPARYLYLDDSIMNFIERSEAPELEESRRIFGRIKNRDLYRCVDYGVFPWVHRQWVAADVTEQAIVAEAKRLDRVSLRAASAVQSQSQTDTGAGAPPTPPLHASQGEFDEEIDASDDSIDEDTVEALTADDIVVAISKLHHGMSEKNPLDYIKFYSKRHPNVCRSAGPEHVSVVMPPEFGEVVLRVYTKEFRYFGLVQAAYRSLVARLGDKPVPAPEPARSPPTTPPPKRTLSRAQSFKSLTGGAGADGSSPGEFGNNPFTKVGKGFGKSAPAPVLPASPTRPGKRAREEGGAGAEGVGALRRSESPARKKR